MYCRYTKRVMPIEWGKGRKERRTSNPKKDSSDIAGRKQMSKSISHYDKTNTKKIV
jgi:hypothetical protein